ncbi:MAG: IS256 family transposase, partial [Eggerthella lenta]|nr:IS256 family transposase [Eggerthella lenta]
ILKEMPTDVLIAEFYRAAAEASEKDEAVGRWGTAVQWNDLHASGPYRMDYD